MCDGGSCRIPRQTVSAIKPLLTGCAARATPAASARCSGPIRESSGQHRGDTLLGWIGEGEALGQRVRVVAPQAGAPGSGGGACRQTMMFTTRGSLAAAPASAGRLAASSSISASQRRARRRAPAATRPPGRRGAASFFLPRPGGAGCTAPTRLRGVPDNRGGVGAHRDQDARDRHRDRRRRRDRVDDGHAGRRRRGQLDERRLAQRRIDDDQDRRQRRRRVFVRLVAISATPTFAGVAQAITSTSTAVLPRSAGGPARGRMATTGRSSSTGSRRR